MKWKIWSKDVVSALVLRGVVGKLWKGTNIVQCVGASVVRVI